MRVDTERTPGRGLTKVREAINITICHGYVST